MRGSSLYLQTLPGSGTGVPSRLHCRNRAVSDQIQPGVARNQWHRQLRPVLSESLEFTNLPPVSTFDVVQAVGEAAL